MIIKGRQALLSGDISPEAAARATEHLVRSLALDEGVDQSQIFSGFEAVHLQVMDSDETILVTKIWAEVLDD